MSRCAPPPQLARAVTEGVPAELAAHAETCAACRDELDAAARVVTLARLVPVPPPRADRREELRTALLARADATAPAPRRRRVWLAASAGLAAAATLAFGLGVGGSPARAHLPHGAVVAVAAARFDHDLTDGDEVVTLRDGTIAVEVAALHAGERFRVVADDAEVEVRGTRFTVRVAAGHLREVTVDHGRVEVRPRRGPARLLEAGTAWTAPLEPTAATAAADLAVEPPAPPDVAHGPPPPTSSRSPALHRAPRAAPAVTTAPPPPPTPPPTRTAASIAYDRGWAALRAGSFDDAAADFARVEVVDPDGALAEDAAYWYAVAVARAHRPEAAGALRAFVHRHPRSVHVGAAGVALGWLLVESGEPAAAAARFRAALDDPSAEVRASAAAGLAATR